MRSRNDGDIFVFCHIPKTGGMTFHDMLRRFFGWKHLIVEPAQEWSYQPSDLERDLKMNPGLASLGGHAMGPFVTFGKHDARMKWYTILRDPIERSISHFQHQREKMDKQDDFHTWIKLEWHQNWHVKMLAGEQDLEAAKQILANKIACFGFIEKYHEFLLLLRSRLNWQSFNVTYKRRRNPPRTDVIRREIQANFDEYREPLLAANELDLALYEYALKELYPLQVQAYGEARLEWDLQEQFATVYETPLEVFQRWQGLAFEKGIYRPVVSLMKKKGNWS